MEVSIKYSRVKHWYARIWLDGILKVTIPARLKNDETFKNMMLEKWKNLYDKYKDRNLEKVQCMTDEHVLIFGQKVPLKNIPWDVTTYIQAELYRFSLPIIQNTAQILWKRHKEIIIKNVKSKRGSCSHDDIIILNQKLAHLPLKFLNYVCIHEACHMKHKNHSKRFWDLVETFLPDHKQIRKELRAIVI